MRPEKSTNVRSSKRTRTSRLPLTTQALVGATRALQRLAPGLAARLAARLFLAAPPRRRTTAPEQDVLARAERRDLAFDGGHLRTWRWGTGPVVVLLHGWGGSAGQLRGFVEPLVHAGYTAVAFDAPGHGDSSGKRTSLPGFAQALMQVARELGPVHAVIAHSFGGAGTSLAIARGLQVARLVYLGVPADARVWFGKFVRGMELDDAVAARALGRLERELGVSSA
jgi:pimeloyl-ACP methyl ester carboxylesterase